jgi:hypothetical protein
MIPVAGAVRMGESSVHGFRLSIPFLVLWILLVPLVPLLVLIVPVVFVAAACVLVNPFKAVGAVIGILAALKGTHVEVANDDFSMLLNIF